MLSRLARESGGRLLRQDRVIGARRLHPLQQSHSDNASDRHQHVTVMNPPAQKLSLACPMGRATRMPLADPQETGHKMVSLGAVLTSAHSLDAPRGVGDEYRAHRSLAAADQLLDR